MCADNLFYVSRAGIFSIYPKILKKMVILDDMAYNPEKNVVALPSDFEWQLKCYFRLLEQQKKLNALDNKSTQELSQIEPHLGWSKLRQQSFAEIVLEAYSPISPNADPSLIKPLGNCDQECRLSVSHEGNNVLWDLSEFAKAGKLLRTPPMDVEFYDEYEMRKVYSLIYDVFRFKLVLQKSLDSIEFLENFPELKADLPRVWLLLYDLYLRTFAKRKPELLPLKDKLFKESEMLYIETCLDKMKTKLAASITKIRIEKQALNLQFLLPIHLRDEKVARAVTNPIISGWINMFKGLNRKEVTKRFESIGFKEIQGDTKSQPKSFRFDKVCPNFFFLWYPREKSEFSQEGLVRDGEVILQNKAFSVGPAIFSKLLTYYEIAGDILQTHILSPRSTAYLASLLIRNRFVGKFRVFGAGSSFNEYQAYFDRVGATNVKLYEESFLSFSRTILEKTVAIYCTPPSSFSSISDPIELICSRGGDLKMLQFLSESEMNDDGQVRAAKILEEQREALKSAMSKPQIQFILYETHSIVESENEDMVKNAMGYVNRKAHDKHVLKAKKEQERLEQELKEKEAMPGIPSSHREPKKESKAAKKKAAPPPPEPPTSNVKVNLNKLKNALKSGSSSESVDAPVDEDAKPKIEPVEVRVPQTDVFEVSPLPDFCLNKDNCINNRTDGCFLSLLRRREIVRMDSKYLIQIAELRGIFGDKDRPKKSKSKAQMRAEKKQEAAMKKAREALERQKIEKFNPSNIDKVVERLLKPTQATIIRITRDEIWRRRYHIMTLRYNELFPPRCARCDYYSQNYYFLSDKFVAIKQFDDTISLRFEENAFQQTVTKRRAQKWWGDLIKYLKQMKMVADLSGTDFSIEVFDKSVIPPLKLIRFPRGYVAPPIKRKVIKGIRQQYSLSIAILDIDHPVRKRRLKSRSRSGSPRLLTLRNYNKCFMCLNEYIRINSGIDAKYF